MMISRYSFEGPYRIGKKVIDRAAVYVILTADNVVVDVGQSGETGTRLATHERSDCWSRNNGVNFAVRWMPSTQYTRADREEIEKRIRWEYSPSCGDR